MMMVVPPSLRGQVFLIHHNARYARCVNFPPIPCVQRNVRNVFLLKEKAAIFFFSADYTEQHPPAAAQCCHFQISNKSYYHQRSCLLCHLCPSDNSSGNPTYRTWGQPLCCFCAQIFCLVFGDNRAFVLDLMRTQGAQSLQWSHWHWLDMSSA